MAGGKGIKDTLHMVHKVKRWTKSVAAGTVFLHGSQVPVKEGAGRRLPVRLLILLSR